MVKMKKKQILSLPAGIGIGTAVSIIISVLFSAVCAWLINGEKMEIGTMGTVAAITQILASFLGSHLATKLTSGKKLLAATATAGAYLLCMLAATALVFDGQYENIGLSLLMVLLGAGITVLLGMKRKRNGNRKHKIPAYR